MTTVPSLQEGKLSRKSVCSLLAVPCCAPGHQDTAEPLWGPEAVGADLHLRLLMRPPHGLAVGLLFIRAVQKGRGGLTTAAQPSPILRRRFVGTH